jgi:hypothetical protein
MTRNDLGPLNCQNEVRRQDSLLRLSKTSPLYRRTETKFVRAAVVVLVLLQSHKHGTISNIVEFSWLPNVEREEISRMVQQESILDS